MVYNSIKVVKKPIKVVMSGEFSTGVENIVENSSKA